MKILSKKGNYRKNGAPVFVYDVECTAAEVTKMKADKGEYYREDGGKPLYWSALPLPVGTVITRTSNGNYVTGDLEKEALAIQESANTFAGKIAAAASALGITRQEATRMMFAVS